MDKWTKRTLYCIPFQLELLVSVNTQEANICSTLGITTLTDRMNFAEN